MMEGAETTVKVEQCGECKYADIQISPVEMEIKTEESATNSTQEGTENNEEKTSEIKETPEDKLDEDVPADFFDDFNNKDFLAGLDVVDAWEDDDSAIQEEKANEIDTKFVRIEKIETTEQVVEKSSSEVETPAPPVLIENENAVESVTKETLKSSKSSVTNVDDSEKSSKTNKDDCAKVVKYTIPRKRRSRSKDRNKEVARVLPQQGKYSDENRRDPDKVRRDIQRDKAKCEKQRISDKLRMVETGLVPPGTEMDMPDLPKEVKRTSEKAGREREEQRTERHSNEALRPARPAKRVYSRSPSPAYRRKRRISRSRSPATMASIAASTVRRRYSPPVYTGRRRSRSPLPRMRSRSRSPLRRRSKSRSPRRIRNRSRSISPTRRYHLNDRHSAKHSRDRSNERKPSFLDELEQKLAQNERTHMQKLSAKINGDGLLPTPAMVQTQLQNIQMQMASGMGMLPSIVPQMVPPPPYETVYPDNTYDQAFFTGGYSNMTYGQTQVASGYQQGDNSLSSSFTNYHQTTLEADKKLFEDDSIMLTEYLKLTHRPGSKALDPGMRTKVLNRNLKALKLMSELERPNGRFFYHVSSETSSECNNGKNKRMTSPLRSTSPVRLAFTTDCSKDRQPTPLNRLMARLNVREKSITLPTEAEVKSYTKNVKTYEEASQTDAYDCDACSARKRVKYVDVGVQCTPETLEFSAQVTEDDFLRTARTALKSILKQQSFASLTPAQILAQLPENKDFDGPSREHEEIAYNRPPVVVGAALHYERRDSREFDRRNERNRSFQSPSPQKNNYPPMYGIHNQGPLNYPMNPGHGPAPLMSMQRIDMHGPGGSPGQYGGYRPPYQNYPNNYGNMRRF